MFTHVLRSYNWEIQNGLNLSSSCLDLVHCWVRGLWLFLNDMLKFMIIEGGDERGTRFGLCSL